MRSILMFLLLMTVMTTGCAGGLPVGESIDIPIQYRPLERVQERPNVILDSSTISTVGRTVYVADLTKFRLKYPFMEPRYRALMAHEQQHALRQRKDGVVSWTAKYLTNTKFMWEQERIGWWFEIDELRRSGLAINPEATALALAGYKNIKGEMVSYAEALTWVKAVLAGTWKP